MSSLLIERALRVVRLDPEVYADIEEDEAATPHAGLIVGAAVVASGLGSIQGGAIMATLGAGIVVAVLGWAAWMAGIWALVSYVITDSATQASLHGFLRMAGFAAAPGAAMLFGIVPGVVGSILSWLVSLWWLATTVFAVQQAYYQGSPAQAAVVSAASWLLMVVVCQVFLFDAVTGLVV